MRSLLNTLLGYFLTPAGLFAMGALDSSVIFFLPLGIDFVVVILSARETDLFWLHALLPTAGSLAGSAVTFWIGRKLGEHGLTRPIRPSRLRRVEARVQHSAALSVGALAIIPPPSPFTAFVLKSAALGANAWTFLATLAGAVRCGSASKRRSRRATAGKSLPGWTRRCSRSSWASSSRWQSSAQSCPQSR